MPNSYGEIFEVELRCWCIGLSRATEHVDRSVLHQVIKEFAPVLREAIENLYACDLIETANRLITSSRCHVSEKEIVFYILSLLPTPLEVSKGQAEVIHRMVDQAEKAYGGAFKRLERKWKTPESDSWRSPLTESSTLDKLSLPAKPLRIEH